VKFQIRDSRFGLCLREAETAEGALAQFVADRLAADGVIAMKAMKSNDDGSAETLCSGLRYMAIPTSRGRLNS
jgi:hypothetical protein